MKPPEMLRPRATTTQLAPGSALVSLSPLPAVAKNAPARSAMPPTPDVLFGALFIDIQQAKLFHDQKIFADAIARRNPPDILADYQMQRHQPGFDLRHFVELNFILPGDGESYVPPKDQSLRQHIDGLWPVLTRSTQSAGQWDSLLPLPRPYVVPGGRFREIYYWDSYFTMLGLAESGRWDRATDMVDNFAAIIDTWGHIPNGNRTYYLSRSQPPFFAMMVELLASRNGEQTLVHYLPQMAREYDYWMAGSDLLKPGEAHQRAVSMPDGTIMNRYWDDSDTPRPESWLDDITTARTTPQRPAADIYRDLRAGAASGWDFSSRWLDDSDRLGSINTTSFVPVDLNALLFHNEQVLAKASLLAGHNTQASRYQQQANTRQRAIEKYLWNHDQGWYADYDLRHQQVNNRLTAAALFPLYLHVASQPRADRMAKVAQSQLLQSGGLVTTLDNSGQQWDAPNGWAPLQWIASVGLQNYGHSDLAMEIVWRFLTNVQHTYNREQKLVEKYNVSTTGTGGGGGEYPLQDGFGWSNGVTLKMLDLLCGAGHAWDNVPETRPANLHYGARQKVPPASDASAAVNNP